MARGSRRHLQAAVCLCFALALGPRLSSAQTNAETNSPWLQLNLSVPGARSLALGGAFLGLSDDATSAYANPAGLAFLPGREISVEGRYWKFHHEFTRGGSLLPGGSPVPGREPNDSRDLSFASLVLGRKSWGLAVYMHRLAKFRAKFDTNGLVLEPGLRLFPARIDHRVDIRNLGASFGKAWTLGGKRPPGERAFQPKIAIGIGRAFYSFELSSRMDRFRVERLDDPAPRLVADNVHDTQTQRGDDGDGGWLAGFLVWPSRDWRFGASFRQGAGFGVEVENVDGPAHRGVSLATPTPIRSAFNVPDVVGVGVMWSPHRRIKLSGGEEIELPRRFKLVLDVYEVGYSVLAADIVDAFGLKPAPGDAEPCRRGELTGQRCGAELDRFVADDGVEVHLGAEILVGPPRRSFFLRVGAWRDPNHALRFEGERAAFREVFKKGEDLDHFSIGVGTTGYRFQFDAAVDWANPRRTRTVSLSSVVRF